MTAFGWALPLYGDGSIRLPLTPMTAANEEKLVGLMREAGIEV